MRVLWLAVCLLGAVGCGAESLLSALAVPDVDAGAEAENDAATGSGDGADAGSDGRSDAGELDVPDAASPGPDGGSDGQPDAGGGDDERDAGHNPDPDEPDAQAPTQDAGPDEPAECTTATEQADCLLSTAPACDAEKGRCVECRVGGPVGQCSDSVLRPSCSLETNTCISRGNACIELCDYLVPTATCIGNLNAGSTTVESRTCAFWLTFEPGSL